MGTEGGVAQKGGIPPERENGHRTYKGMRGGDKMVWKTPQPKEQKFEVRGNIYLSCV